jgi:hypothetical protein
MIKGLALVLFLGLPLRGATCMNYSFTLENGALVLYQTYSEIALPDHERAFGTASASGNVVRRTMLDEKRQAWLAFELHIERKPGPGPIRFLLSMEPLGGSAFFGQKAAPREIENGDRILMDVLEEPGTGRKIFDTFQVGMGVPMQIMPLPRSVPQIPGAGTAIHIQDPRFMNGLDVFAQTKGSATGPEVAISVPNRGRFIFSSQSEPGFRMEAIVDGARLLFVVGGNMYDVPCSAPVVEPAGSWYLWVRREPLEGRATVPNLDLSIQ